MICQADYAFVSRLLLEHSGLAVGPNKEYLLESRLLPVAAELGLTSLQALVDRLRIAPHGELVRRVCEAIATNETSFFRDGVPFDLIRTRILPELLRHRDPERSLRIWCAAASTGQEPYSVAMILDDLPVSDWNVEIIATDFSRPALNRARTGVFTTFEVQRGLTADQRVRFFTPYGDDWRLRDSTRNRVTFAELNLIHSFAHLGRFDLVLCRNVLIYFDVNTKRDVLERLSTVLAPGGYLILGAAESAIGITHTLERVADLPTSAYQATAVPEMVGLAN